MRHTARGGAGVRLRRVAPIALAVTVAALSAATRASAHAAFADAQPEPGARVARAPQKIRLDFTESLNRGLSHASLTNVATGKRVRTHVASESGRSIVIRPVRTLARAPYRVDWQTVSTTDGHPLQGFFTFGVQTPAVGGAHQVELSPLAGLGAVRAGVRAIFYALLLYFAGGVLTAALLSSGRQPAAWLLPESGDDVDRSAVARRAWARTVDAGWLAAAAGVAVAVIESVDASGGFSLRGLDQYLLANAAGVTRIAVPGVLIAATVVASRSRPIAVTLIALVFWLIGAGGHANSASPSSLAVVSDALHLLAAAAWLGGIAQIAVCWLPQLRTSSRELRLSVMRSVLPRFGKVALPAFTVLVAAGVANAVIELGRPAELWSSAYGAVLLTKIILVGLIALASWTHALRLRPRLIAANPHPPSRLERRHWRLLGSEPLLGAGVAAAAALLVAFPLPPRQLQEKAEAAPAAGAAASTRACGPCPQRKPRADELGVAEQAGSSIAAFWLRQGVAGLSGELRLLDSNGRPVSEPAEVIGARKQQACGPGCWQFSLPTRPALVAVRVLERGHAFEARVPARWSPAGTATAEAMLRRAQRVMQELRGLRDEQVVTSGPGSFARTTFRLQAPDRFAYVTDQGVHAETIGKWEWSRAGNAAWQKDRYGGGGPGFRTRSWFRWTSYASSVRLLGLRTRGGRKIAEIALMDEGAPPVWFRLDIDLATMRVPTTRMITGGHFMTDNYVQLDRPQTIRPPRAP